MQMSKKYTAKPFMLALALLHSSGGVVTGLGVYQTSLGYTSKARFKA